MTPPPPLRVVFDTNVVVSALLFRKKLEWLRLAWARRAVVPVVCRQTVDELMRVLGYPKFRLDPAACHAVLEDYLPFSEVHHLADPLPVLAVACRDRDDVVFLQLTIAAGADCLVSGDSDLVVLRRTMPVMRPSELRERLAAVA